MQQTYGLQGFIYGLFPAPEPARPAKNTGTPSDRIQAYYRAAAEASKGCISASVYPDQTYDNLLLGGKDGVLLTAGFEKSKTIEAGKKNIVGITILPVPVQWNGTNAIGYDTSSAASNTASTNDFTFDITDSSDGSAAAATTERAIIITKTSANYDAETKLTVNFNLSKFSPLIYMEQGCITIQNYAVVLYPKEGSASPPLNLRV